MANSSYIVGWDANSQPIEHESRPISARPEPRAPAQLDPLLLNRLTQLMTLNDLLSLSFAVFFSGPFYH